jgi:hypothetical protein
MVTPKHTVGKFTDTSRSQDCISFVEETTIPSKKVFRAFTMTRPRKQGKYNSSFYTIPVIARSESCAGKQSAAWLHTSNVLLDCFGREVHRPRNDGAKRRGRKKYFPHSISVIARSVVCDEAIHGMVAYIISMGGLLRRAKSSPPRNDGAGEREEKLFSPSYNFRHCEERSLRRSNPRRDCIP